jgi:UDP-N-acetylglucosamine acyltransferase
MSIHPTALVDPCARIDPTAEIGPHVVIDGPVQVGPATSVGPHAVLLGRTELGANCRVHAHAVLGDIPQDRAYTGEPTRCVIGAGTIIREGATVHRSTGAETATVVGERCYLMTNAHVGHNCRLGNDVALVSGALLGGHVQIGDRTIVSGNTALHQFVRVGTLAMLAGVAAIVQDVPPFALTDHWGRVAGINLVGLKRAGYTAEQRADVKRAYRLLYRSGIPNREIVDVLRREPRTDALAPLIEFLEVSTPRGLCKAAPRLRVAE